MVDLRAQLETAGALPMRERRPVYIALLAATLYVRQPLTSDYALTQPDTGRRAIPAFLSEGDGLQFWAQVAPGHAVTIEPRPFVELAARAKEVGALVIDPGGADLVLDRGELMQLAVADVPGDFAAWLSNLGRLGRQPSEVMAQLKRSFVHVITGKSHDGEQRLYLLEKSEDGTQAVACFSSPDTLSQFAQVRRLFEGDAEYGVAVVEGEYCLRAASGLGAYVLLDPESPWETQLEPTLM